jgi:hypothetical protein
MTVHHDVTVGRDVFGVYWISTSHTLILSLNPFVRGTSLTVSYLQDTVLRLAVHVRPAACLPTAAPFAATVVQNYRWL